MIYGTPGGSLAAGHFGTDARRAAGRAGELLTAQVLNSFHRNAAILHDLTVPHPNLSFNIDHAVVAGNRVLIVDSKLWAAGRYWTVGSACYRGWERRHTPSHAVRIARELLDHHLPAATLVTPVVVLWSGAQTRRPLTVDTAGRVRGVAAAPRETARPFLHFTYPGARTVTGNKLHGIVKRFTRPGAPDPAVVHALTGLLHR